MNNENHKPEDFIENTESSFHRKETTHPYTKENLKTLRGRMNRLDFVILMFSISLVTVFIYKYLGINPVSMSAMAMLDPENLPQGLRSTVMLSSLGVVLFALLSVKRLHDINYSGWIALIFLVPIAIGGLFAVLAAIVGFILRMILMFAPGIPVDNRFGQIPVGNNRNKILILIVVLFLLFNVYSGFLNEAAPYLEQLREHMLEMQK